MTANPSVARNDTFKLIGDAFANGPVQPAPEIIWQVDRKQSLWGGSDPWLHVAMIHTNGFQASIATINGRKRWRRTGTILMQAHVPLNYDGDLLGLVEQINETGENALMGKVSDNGVEYNSVIAIEVGQNGPWHISNITATFSYDEIIGD